MNRTFLFLLVVGLFFVAWQRDKQSSPPATAAAPSSARPSAAALTNSTSDHALVSVENSIHK